MAMTKKHFRAFADLVHEVRTMEIPDTWDSEFTRAFLTGYLESRMASIFQSENPYFDQDRFSTWCASGTDR